MSHRRRAGQQPMLYPSQGFATYPHPPHGAYPPQGALAYPYPTQPGYPAAHYTSQATSGCSPLQMYQPGYMEPADSSDGLEAKIDYLENCERRLGSGQALGTEEMRHLVSCRMATLLRKRHKKMKNVRRKRDRMEDVLSDSELDYYVV